jgi:hypothetical protein
MKKWVLCYTVLAVRFVITNYWRHLKMRAVKPYND